MDGQRIRDLRTQMGWTQLQLAVELGTDPVTVSRWERGVAHPRPAAMRRLDALSLAVGPTGEVRFSEEPAIRLGKLDRARREQLDLKRRARF